MNRLQRSSQSTVNVRLSRRTLLRGASGVAIALPFLEIMGRPGAASGAGVPGRTSKGLPKRFVVWFTPNGTIPSAWSPSGGETDFTFSRILKPLEPFRKRLLIIEGLKQTGEGGDGHQNGMQGMLTGQRLNPGIFRGGEGDSAGFANGISVDQRIAQVIGGTTTFKSLELAVQPGSGEDNWNRMSLLGPNQPLPPEMSPYKAFARLFKDYTAPSQSSSHADRDRKVLSAVAENFRQLNAKLGADDRRRLDAHLQAVSELEGRLGLKPKGALPACAAPVLGAPADFQKNVNFPAVGKLQMDLLAMALTCDMTRVGSLMWNHSVGNACHTWVDPKMNRGHHELSHDGDNDADSVEKLTKINVWYAEQLASFLQRLDAVPEGDGSLLDNTIVLWCNELAKGNTHSREDSHYVIAGSGGGEIKLGRYLKIPNQQPHNQLLLALLNAMGVADTSFGNPEWCDGPLAGVLA